MDSYGIFHPDTHLQTQNSSFWVPKHQILGFRGLGFLDAWGRIFGGPGGCWEYIAILLRWLAGLGGVPGFRQRPNWKVKWSFWPQDQQYNRLLDWDNRTEGL